MRNHFKITASNPGVFALAITLALQGPHVFSAEVLTLNTFLSQVKTNHTGVKGALLTTQGGQLRSEEGKVAISPTAYFNASFSSDSKLASGSLLGYSNTLSRTFSLGVSQLTTFGLQAKLHYDVTSQSLVNPDLLFTIPGLSTGGSNSPFVSNTNNASPILELTQSLWGNGFGKSTRATIEQQEAQALASSYNASYQAKTTLSDSEKAYWRLVLARQIVAVQVQALDRAQKIYDWNVRRARLQLTDQSDVLQSDASLQSRTLELTTARNEERSASRNFNSVRNRDSEVVPEQLTRLDISQIEEIHVPQRAELRDDVKAALQNSRASTASATVAQQKNLPTLEAFAVLALNGQPAPSFGDVSSYVSYQTLSDSMANSFTFNRPTETIGIRFSIPLDLDLTSKTREGWAQDYLGAEMTYTRKFFDQEQQWKDYNESLNEARVQLNLSKKLENIQESKLNNERDRLHHGRTTTYQVLLFEQDYLQAQLTRIKNQANVLNIIAQMKTFGENI